MLGVDHDPGAQVPEGELRGAVEVRRGGEVPMSDARLRELEPFARAREHYGQ